MLRKIGVTIVFVILTLTAAHFFFQPPSLEGRTVSHAIKASSDTMLGEIALNFSEINPQMSGVLPLLDGPDAFASRIALIRAAQKAIDIQYYIWQRDGTGLILLDELRKAAERGVRVRLLLDDNGIPGLDSDLAALNALPNIEIRLFNPFILRKFKPLGFAFDFMRLNRRMHNKSLTADGAISIIGGRNIGDVYFGFGEGVQFIDTDVMIAGPVAAEIGTDFDRYWESRSSHPLERIVGAVTNEALDQLILDAQEAETSEQGTRYEERVRGSNFVARLAANDLKFEWTKITLVSDDPAKAMGKAENGDLLFSQLMTLVSQPSRSIDLVSAYFVPGRVFLSALERLAGKGVQIRILTNSQAATDVMVVHSAYVKYRPEVLRAGIELYELKPDFSAKNEPKTLGFSGSSSASLHSKTLAVDEERIFIGSFNFDVRSFFLNTEMGVVIESPTLAKALASAFLDNFSQASYTPKLAEGENLVWEEIGPNGIVVRHGSEPGTNIFSRLWLQFLGLLPIEWLL